MDLTALERDLLGDVAQDAHGLWEVFAFVRLHHRGLSEPELLQVGRDLLATWIARGWLALGAVEEGSPAIERIEELVPLVDRLGPRAMDTFEGVPWLELGAKAYQDVPWLSDAV